MKRPRNSQFFCYCNVEGCTKNQHGNGLCSKHYWANKYKENKDAVLKRTAAYYRANKEKVCERHRQYYEANKEDVKVKHKQWYSKNKESVFGRSRKWQINNKDKVRLSHRKWSRKNAGRCSAKCARRRAMKLQRTPKWLSKEQLDQIRIIYDNKPAGYHVDHIVPLKGENVSGLHVPWNLQYLTTSENCRKKNKHG